MRKENRRFFEWMRRARRGKREKPLQMAENRPADSAAGRHGGGTDADLHRRPAVSDDRLGSVGAGAVRAAVAGAGAFLSGGADGLPDSGRDAPGLSRAGLRRLQRPRGGHRQPLQLRRDDRKIHGSSGAGHGGLRDAGSDQHPPDQRPARPSAGQSGHSVLLRHAPRRVAGTVLRGPQRRQQVHGAVRGLRR